MLMAARFIGYLGFAYFVVYRCAIISLCIATIQNTAVVEPAAAEYFPTMSRLDYVRVTDAALKFLRSYYLCYGQQHQ